MRVVKSWAGATICLAAVSLVSGCGGQHKATSGGNHTTHRPAPGDPQVEAYSQGYRCGSNIPALVVRFPRVPIRSLLNGCVKSARNDGIKEMAWAKAGIRDGVYDTLGEPKKTIRYHCTVRPTCGADRALVLHWKHMAGG
jgi:hypothetical protein